MAAGHDAACLRAELSSMWVATWASPLPVGSSAATATECSARESRSSAIAEAIAARDLIFYSIRSAAALRSGADDA
eukprot:5206588-Pleurochrysis_carterae.AAC.1